MVLAFLAVDVVLAVAHVGNLLVGAPSRKITLLLGPGVPGSVPDWWAGCQLFLAAMLAAVVASTWRPPATGRGRSRRWLLSIVLLLLSVDRVAGLQGWLADHAPALLRPAEAAAEGASFRALAGIVHAVPLILVGAVVVLLWPFLSAVRRVPARYLAAAAGLAVGTGLPAWLPGGTAGGVVELVLVTGSGTLFVWASWDLFEAGREVETAGDRVPADTAPEHCYCRGYLGFHLMAGTLIFAAVFLPRSLAWRLEGGVAVDGVSLGGGRIAVGRGLPSDGVAIRDLGPSSTQTSLGLDTTADEIVAGEVVTRRLRRRSVRYLTDGVLRWSVDVDGVPELGADSGSIFGINRYSDEGMHLGTEFVILRENGNVGLGARGRSVVVGGGELFQTPPNALAVSGNLAIGESFSRRLTAPPDGMIVQGDVVLGDLDPVARLTVEGSIQATGALVVGDIRLVPPTGRPAAEAGPKAAAGVVAGVRAVALEGGERLGLLPRDAASGGQAIDVGELVAALTILVDEQRQAIEELRRSVRRLEAGSGH